MVEILESLGPLVLTLAIVIFVIYLSYLFSRRIAVGAAGFSKAKYMKIIDRIIVGQDKYIAIVQIGSSHLLVSITATSIKILKELNNEDIVEFMESENNKPALSESFKDTILKVMSKKEK